MADLFGDGPLPSMEDLAAELRRQHEEAGNLSLELTPFEALCLIGQLQLAARHPANSGFSRDTGVRAAQALTSALRPLARAVAAAGWDPARDEET